MPQQPAQDPDLWNWVATHWDATIGWIFGAGATWGMFRSAIKDHGVRIARLEQDGPAGLKRLEDKMDAHHTQVIGLMMGIAANRPQNQ